MTGPVYAARRLLLAVPLLLGMSVLVFGLMRIIPGDPAVTVLGYKATPDAVRAVADGRRYVDTDAARMPGRRGLDCYGLTRQQRRILALLPSVRSTRD